MTQLIIIGVYLSLLLCLGLFASRLFRGTSKDYMLASHSIGPFLLLMSLFGTTMTAFALVGSTGEAFVEGAGVYGMLASSSGIIHSLCFFLIGVKIWSHGRRYGYTTQIEFFRDRLQSDKIGLLLFPILVGLVIPYLLIGVIAGGVVFEAVTEGAFDSAFAENDYAIPAWLGSLIICIVVLIYVFFGGMRGTAWANAFQTCVFMVLGVVTYTLIADKLGGAVESSERVKEKHPSKLMRAADPTEDATHEKDFATWKKLAYYNWAGAVDNGKIELSPGEKEAAYKAYPPTASGKVPAWAKEFEERRAEGLYAIKHKNLDEVLTEEEKLKALIEQDDRVVPDPLPEDFVKRDFRSFPKDPDWEERAVDYFKSKGQVGHPNEPKKMTRKQAIGRYRAKRWAPVHHEPISRLKFFTYLLIPLSVGMFPHLFQHWLTAKSAKTFKLPVVAHPVFIMIVWAPCVLLGIWATSATLPANDKVALIPPHFPANAVLPYMVKELTTPILAGLLTAGILAAIMSSLDSQFLCLGTMFTNDIVVHYGGEKRFSDKQKVLLARAFIVGIVLVTYLFSLYPQRRVFQMGVWCFSGFSSLFPVVFAALYWRRLTKAGAYAGIIAAATSWLVLFVMSDFAKDTRFDVFGMMPVVTMFACSALATVLVSLVTKPPDEAVIARFFKPKNQASP